MSFTTSIKKLFRPARAVVLMYHRIAEPEVDPWQLSVSKQNFESHLNILSASGRVVRTGELIEMLSRRQLVKDVVCLTFDDGYEDNFLHALPLLERYNCPATFFISTGNIGSGEPYWWDALTDIFLTAKKLPAALQISIGERDFLYNLDNDGWLMDHELKMHKSWHWPAEPPTQRAKIYFEIWTHLRDLPGFTIRDVVKTLVEWSELRLSNKCGSFPMTRTELISMFQSSQAESGVHTITHAALSAFPKQIQHGEILGCKEYLDVNLQKTHSLMAYPYGNYNSDTLEVVKNAGMKAAFTTDARCITARSDLFQLGRFQVIDQPGDVFSRQLNKWLKQ
jgi:peptidoglycan/xylan/chitin deacetylase (PgdA/CDA1 family)